MGNNESQMIASATGVYDKTTGYSYEDNLKPTSKHTAHEQILIKNGLNRKDCVGYSVKDDGSLGFRSESINRKNSWGWSCSDTKFKKEIESGRSYFQDQRTFNPNSAERNC